MYATIGPRNHTLLGMFFWGPISTMVLVVYVDPLGKLLHTET